MSDGELHRLATQYDSLTDEAQLLLRAEFAHRSMEPPFIEESAHEVLQGVATIRQYRDQGEAMLARSVLESAGVSCFLRDENTVRIDWLWSNLMGGIRLQVAEEDVAAAEAILTQPIPTRILQPGEPDYEQPQCPKCHSLDITYETLDRKVAATSLLILGIPLPSPIERDTWLCHNCGTKWTDDPDASGENSHA
ncbi:putative signal transducing protein [Granulicella sibirica]|nr:DUF2007 domain-containing protein [Granulicella sibirica]